MVKFSVKKPLTVFVAVLAVLVLRVVAYLQMSASTIDSMTRHWNTRCGLRAGRGGVSENDTGPAAQHGFPLCGHRHH